MSERCIFDGLVALGTVAALVMSIISVVSLANNGHVNLDNDAMVELILDLDARSTELHRDVHSKLSHHAEVLSNHHLKAQGGRTSNFAEQHLGFDDDDSTTTLSWSDLDEEAALHALSTSSNYSLFVPRDDYDSDTVIAAMDQFVAYYLSNSTSYLFLTIPGFDWQTNNPIPFDRNIPRITHAVHELDSDERIQLFLTMCLAVQFDFMSFAREVAFSNERLLQEPWLANKERRASVRSRMREYTRAILDDDQIAEVDPALLVALQLQIIQMNAQINMDNGLNTYYEDTFTIAYYGPEVLGHTTFISYSSQNGRIPLFQTYSMLGYFSIAPDAAVDLGLGESQIAALPSMMEHDARRLRTLANYEEDSIGVFFPHALVYDASRWTSANEAVDPEGIAQYPGYSSAFLAPRIGAVDLSVFLEEADITTLAQEDGVRFGAAQVGADFDIAEPFRMHSDWRNGVSQGRGAHARRPHLPASKKRQAPFVSTSLSVEFEKLNYVGPVSVLTYESINLGFDTMGIKEFVDLWTRNSEQTDDILRECGLVWDNQVRHEVRRIGLALQEKASHMADDHYPGFFRGKIAHIYNVTRDEETLEAIDMTIAFSSAELELDAMQLVVPFDPSSNEAYATVGSAVNESLLAAIEKVQADMDEMEGYYRNSLEYFQMASTGDLYPQISKSDLTLGVSVPYASVEAIVDNYQATFNELTDNFTIVDAEVESGMALVGLFDDINVLLANEVLEEKYAEFNFSSAMAAGVGDTNDDGDVIELADVVAYLRTITAKSDVEVLNRHYGYYSNGTIKADEWDNGELVYGFTEADYIYRQHYLLNESMPMVPSNIYDPVTGKAYYQATDAGDETRYEALVDAYYATEAYLADHVSSVNETQNRKGTYYRFKYDYMMQSLYQYVIENADSLGIFPQDFIDEYCTDTFVNTYESSTAGPELALVRVLGQASGSATSEPSVSLLTKKIVILNRFSTFTPDSAPRMDLSTILHEAALGHGFEVIPSFFEYIRTFEVSTSYVMSGGVVDETFWNGAFYSTPGAGVLAEGWATFAEIFALMKNLYVKFDSEGAIIEPVALNQDVEAALRGNIELKRIAARKVVDIHANSKRFAFSFNRMVREFEDLSGIDPLQVPSFMQRFVGSPGQQTTYGSGFLVTIGTLNSLKTIVAEDMAYDGCTFDEAKFVQWRVTTGATLGGSALAQLAVEDLPTMVTC